MHDGAPGTLETFERPGDEVGARLGEHLYGHVIGDEVALDELACEVEIRLGGGRKSDLDFLEPDLQQLFEHAHFAGRVHRLDERLITVAQVDTAPGRRRGDGPARPGAVGQINGSKRSVLVGWGTQHGKISLAKAPGESGLRIYSRLQLDRLEVRSC